MTKQVQRVAIACFVLFAALFVNLNVVQVVQSRELAEDNRNARQLFREYEIRRGGLVAGDGATELATVEETGGDLRYRRRYPEGQLYAHLTGYYSPVYGRSELEQSFNSFLAGSAPEAFTRNLADLLAGRERTGDDVITTVDPGTQRAAVEAFDGRRGAAVALDPRTGEVLALVSSPSFDPDLLSSHAREDVREYWTALNEDPDRPLRNRALREWYPPGSTFKVITTAAALESGVQPDDTFDDPARLSLPQTTATIGNFGGGTCAGGSEITLARAFQVSCNTTFAQLGLDLGDDALRQTSEAFGLNADLDHQVGNVLVSQFPTAELDPPSTAQSAIGQRDVRVTPMQMAMVAAAVGNGGVLMEPHLVRQVEDERRQLLADFPPEPLVVPGVDSSQAISAETARDLTAMMVAAVDGGTGQNARIDGVQVAGKTGTAQTGGDGPPTVWFVGFAPADNPSVAVAVVLEDGGGVGDEATGGALAAPLARSVMDAALARPSRGG